MDSMVALDPFADASIGTSPALYACWECPEICW